MAPAATAKGGSGAAASKGDAGGTSSPAAMPEPPALSDIRRFVLPLWGGSLCALVLLGGLSRLLVVLGTFSACVLYLNNPYNSTEGREAAWKKLHEARAAFKAAKVEGMAKEGRRLGLLGSMLASPVKSANRALSREKVMQNYIFFSCAYIGGTSDEADTEHMVRVVCHQLCQQAVAATATDNALIRTPCSVRRQWGSCRSGKAVHPSASALDRVHEGARRRALTHPHAHMCTYRYVFSLPATKAAIDVAFNKRK